MSPIKVERTGDIAVVTLNRPEALNALSRALQDDLARAFRALEKDDDVRVVILTGEGERAFSAGLDLKELGQGVIKLGGGDPDADDCVAAITALSKPVIGAINGVAITGGLEVALACDILIASVNARFADTHARVGVIPGWGLSQRLSRTIGLSRAKQMSLSGNFIDASTALAWGLVNEVVPADELMTRAKALATDVASVEQPMVRQYKRLIDEGFAMSFAEAIAHERHVSGAYNAGLDPEGLEARRGAVQQRGRATP
jgi:enoyl-CoA hydratase